MQKQPIPERIQFFNIIHSTYIPFIHFLYLLVPTYHNNPAVPASESRQPQCQAKKESSPESGNVESHPDAPFCRECLCEHRDKQPFPLRSLIFFPCKKPPFLFFQ